MEVITENVKDFAEVEFEEEQYFPALGQSIVFYNEDGYVIGGGIIEHIPTK